MSDKNIGEWREYSRLVISELERLNEQSEKLEAQIDKIDTKVQKLLEFKWQIVGGSIVFSTIATLILNFILRK